jgi:hypothetical protein
VKDTGNKVNPHTIVDNDIGDADFFMDLFEYSREVCGLSSIEPVERILGGIESFSSRRDSNFVACSRKSSDCGPSHATTYTNEQSDRHDYTFDVNVSGKK